MAFCDDFTESDIINFINGFTKENKREVVKLFTEGYCYWFAHILQTMYGGDIYYLPITGHFVIKIRDSFYDVNGKYIPNEPTEHWESYQSIDPIASRRIIRDCILKLTWGSYGQNESGIS